MTEDEAAKLAEQRQAEMDDPNITVTWRHGCTRSSGTRLGSIGRYSSPTGR